MNLPFSLFQTPNGDEIPVILAELMQRRNAHITFVNPNGAYEALRERTHFVGGTAATASASFTWHQPHQDLVQYLVPSENWQPNGHELGIYNALVAALNEDCIERFLPSLDFVNLYISVQHNETFKRIATRIRELNITRASKPYTLMEFRQIFRTLRWGHSIFKLTLASNAFINPKLICMKLPRYIGHQLTSLTLTTFQVTSDDFMQMRELLVRLKFCDLGLAYDFNFELFNCMWPQLHTLRIETSAHVHSFAALPNTTAGFPALRILDISTKYLFYNDLIAHVAGVCPNLEQFTLRGFVDIYASMVPVRDSLCLAPLRTFRRLRKLHLSMDVRTFVQNINLERMGSVFTLPTVRNLTLEFSNVTETQLMSIRRFIDALNRIGRVMVNLKDLTLSCIPLEASDFMLLIKSTPSLERIFISECLFMIDTTHLACILQTRRRLFNSNRNQIKQLKLQFNRTREDQEIVAVKYLAFSMFYSVGGYQTVYSDLGGFRGRPAKYNVFSVCSVCHRVILSGLSRI